MLSETVHTTYQVKLLTQQVHTTESKHDVSVVFLYHSHKKLHKSLCFERLLIASRAAPILTNPHTIKHDSDLVTSTSH